jgi:hypothetical protein
LGLETIVSVSLAKKICIQQIFTAAGSLFIFKQKISGNNNEPYVYFIPTETGSIYDKFYKQEFVSYDSNICIYLHLILIGLFYK